jgi:hypothetical protein
MGEFVPWMQKQVTFRKSGTKDADKFLEGQLVRWTVLPREIGQKAAEYPAVAYDPSRRLVLIEAQVVFLNKAGGQIESIFLEDGGKRRYVPPDGLFRDYWGRAVPHAYSEVDRYFVEPLCGSLLRKYLPFTPVAAQSAPAPVHAMIRPKEEVVGGIGFYVPEGARGLQLTITALMQIEETVLGGAGGMRTKQTREQLRLKVGDVPAGPG